jgi:hypothetical protein
MESDLRHHLPVPLSGFSRRRTPIKGIRFSRPALGWQALRAGWQTLGAAAFGCATLFAPTTAAGPAEEPFYHQFLDLKTDNGYRPTRTFTIITDPNHGNRLVAEDDPDLQFNVLWLDQYQDGYKTRDGGSALGYMLREYLKSAYKSYRERNAQRLSALPDEKGNGSITGFEGEMHYRLRWSDDEVKVGVEYNY